MSRLQDYLDNNLGKLSKSKIEDENVIKQNLCKNIGNQVRKLRKGKGISQAEVAKISNINQGNISKIENGEINFKIKTLERIVDAIGGSLKIKVY